MCASCLAESAVVLAKRAAETPSPASRAVIPGEAVCLRCVARSPAPSVGTNPWQARFPRVDILGAAPRSSYSPHRQDKRRRPRAPSPPPELSLGGLLQLCIRFSYLVLPFGKSTAEWLGCDICRR